jgi:hypothetical protein
MLLPLRGIKVGKNIRLVVAPSCRDLFVAVRLAGSIPINMLTIHWFFSNFPDPQRP